MWVEIQSEDLALTTGQMAEEFFFFVFYTKYLLYICCIFIPSYLIEYVPDFPEVESLKHEPEMDHLHFDT